MNVLDKVILLQNVYSRLVTVKSLEGRRAAVMELSRLVDEFSKQYNVSSAQMLLIAMDKADLADYAKLVNDEIDRRTVPSESARDCASCSYNDAYLGCACPSHKII